jgi:hypothetical protein
MGSRQIVLVSTAGISSLMWEFSGGKLKQKGFFHSVIYEEMRRPLIINDFATAPFWISLHIYEENCVCVGIFNILPILLDSSSL